VQEKFQQENSGKVPHANSVSLLQQANVKEHARARWAPNSNPLWEDCLLRSSSALPYVPPFAESGIADLIASSIITLLKQIAASKRLKDMQSVLQFKPAHIRKVVVEDNDISLSSLFSLKGLQYELKNF
jgi:hypothetical protein